ncbi:hypothetical protein D1007_39944 [Hordeum vulgare]|nr:hypothetical protein D1007_39944 [Hordeum vulgare]
MRTWIGIHPLFLCSADWWLRIDPLQHRAVRSAHSTGSWSPTQPCAGAMTRALEGACHAVVPRVRSRRASRERCRCHAWKHGWSPASASEACSRIGRSGHCRRP